MSTNFSPNYEATPASPADWDGLDSQAHAVQFYAEDASLLDGLGRFIGSAIGAGDAAVVIATKAHRDGLTQRLQASGLDVAVAQKRGAICRTGCGGNALKVHGEWMARRDAIC